MFRSKVRSHRKTITVAALGPVLAFSLVACGGSSSTSSAAPTPAANASGAPTAGGGARGAFGGADFAKIQACLQAAGISLPTRTGFPRPSGSFVRPTGVRPTGVRPSGGPGFGGGAGRGMFADPKVQAALKACGIAVPTFGPRPAGGATS